VAVLGGGLSSLATAFELTSQSNAYDITVYQMGWRLGGKCATGRNPEADLGRRIEEHGLHVFFGSYENAFYLLRQAFEELDRKTGPLQTWQDAFHGHSSLVLQQQFKHQWHPWGITFPEMPGQPGDRAKSGGSPKPIRDLAVLLFEFVKEQIEKEVRLHKGGKRPITHGHEKALEHLNCVPTADDKKSSAGFEVGNPLDRWLMALLDHLWRWLEKEVGEAGEILAESDLAARRVWIIAEMGAAMLHGLYELVVTGKDFDDINHLDFVAWLDENALFGGGLSKITRESAPIRMCYELAFAFEDGDTDKPNVAAGVAANNLLRMALDFQGSLYYEMQAGCAEVTVTPLYQALLARGVKFRFFHEVKELNINDAGELVSFDVSIQATPKPGRSYDPLVEVAEIHAWPSVPRYELLAQGADLMQGKELAAGGYDLESPWTAWQPVCKKTFERGQDFDLVVLGISIGALEPMCRQILSREDEDGPWHRMLAGTRTVATQSTQLWFDVETEQLGWIGPDKGQPKKGQNDPKNPEPFRHPISGTFVDPLSNWADFTHLIEVEDWGDKPPRSLAYLCGPIVPTRTAPKPGEPNYDYQLEQRAEAQKVAIDFLNESAAGLWPKAVTANGFDWKLLVDRLGANGKARFNSQYHRANVSPWERYVNSFAGSIETRLRQEESGIDCLYLTGDWTYNGLNVGAAEAAMMSGRMAARAVLGKNYSIYGAPPLGS
jgi:uncharacterized protein with NAD-binding domain and iron-sulfur cluster